MLRNPGFPCCVHTSTKKFIVITTGKGRKTLAVRADVSHTLVLLFSPFLMQCVVQYGGRDGWNSISSPLGTERENFFWCCFAPKLGEIGVRIR